MFKEHLQAYIRKQTANQLRGPLFQCLKDLECGKPNFASEEIVEHFMDWGFNVKSRSTSAELRAFMLELNNLTLFMSFHQTGNSYTFSTAMLSGSLYFSGETLFVAYAGNPVHLLEQINLRAEKYLKIDAAQKLGLI